MFKREDVFIEVRSADGVSDQEVARLAADRISREMEARAGRRRSFVPLVAALVLTFAAISTVAGVLGALLGVEWLAGAAIVALGGAVACGLAWMLIVLWCDAIRELRR
ncbi:hypothetical protein [Microbacterium sp. KNMS]